MKTFIASLLLGLSSFAWPTVARAIEKYRVVVFSNENQTNVRGRINAYKCIGLPSRYMDVAPFSLKDEKQAKITSYYSPDTLINTVKTAAGGVQFFAQLAKNSLPMFWLVSHSMKCPSFESKQYIHNIINAVR